MTIVKHPTLDAAHDVPPARVAEWVAAGWIVDVPELADVPDTEPAGKTREALPHKK